MNQAEMLQPTPERDYHATKLIQHLFRLMCKEENTPQQMWSQYLPEYFLRWAYERMPLMNQVEVCAEAGCKLIGWEFLLQMAGNCDGSLMLAPKWPAIVTEHRGKLKHKVKRLQMLMMVTYEDGSIFPMHLQTIPEFLVGGELTDALAAGQVFEHGRVLLKQILEMGLDKIHDTYFADFKGERGLELIFGTILKLRDQFKPDDYALMMNYMRLIQGIMLPKVDPKDREQALLHRSRQEAAIRTLSGEKEPYETTAVLGGPTGGFDE